VNEFSNFSAGLKFPEIKTMMEESKEKYLTDMTVGTMCQVH
jgi:hypothetical protein